MTDWQEMARAGKEAIEENRSSFDFDVVAGESANPQEVERRVKKHFGKRARVTSAGEFGLHPHRRE